VTVECYAGELLSQIAVTAERRFATIVVWNVADNHFAEPVTASMQRVRDLGSQFKLDMKVVNWVIKSQPEEDKLNRADL